MSKRMYAFVICAVVVFAIVAMAAGPAFCQSAGQGASQAVLEAKRQALEEKAIEALKAKEWTIYITPKDGKYSGETDVLIFSDGTMETKNLSAKGYPVSNITLSVSNDGSFSWETMKTTALKDKAFCRGDLRNGIMTGTMVMKSSKGMVSTFHYTTVPQSGSGASYSIPSKADTKEAVDTGAAKATETKKAKK